MLNIASDVLVSRWICVRPLELAGTIAAWLLKPENTKPESDEWAKEDDVPNPASDTLAAFLATLSGQFPKRGRTIVLISAVNTVLAIVANR